MLFVQFSILPDIVTGLAFSRPSGDSERSRDHNPLRVLFVANDSLVLPILFSQGLPHLKALARKGHSIWILSFEGAQRYYADQEERYARTREELRGLGIRTVAPPAWLFRGTPKVLVKLLAGSLLAVLLVTIHRIDVVHARSFFPAVTALLCKSMLGTRMIFDMRSLYVDEQIPLGRLRRGTTRYRLMRRLERRVLLSSDAVVAVSAPFAEHLRRRRDVWEDPPNGLIHTIPNCVDTERFRPQRSIRHARRTDLGIDHRLVFLAVMSWMSPRYALREMADFILLFRQKNPGAFLLVLANRPPRGEAERLLGEFGLQPANARVINASPHEVPDLMQAGDVGMFFGGSGFNQEIVFPIKFAEYLASGVPIVINNEIGHLRALIEHYRVGIALDIHSRTGLEQGVVDLLDFLKSDRVEIQRRCRRLAIEQLSLKIAVDAYDRIYRRLGQIR